MDDSIIEQMQAWGAPPEEIAKARAQLPDPDAPRDGDEFPIHRENVPVIEAFLALRTQWTYAGAAGQRMGLNYAALIAWVQQHARPRRRRALIADLRVMECAVLVADKEQRTEKE